MSQAAELRTETGALRSLDEAFRWALRRRHVFSLPM